MRSRQECYSRKSRWLAGAAGLFVFAVSAIAATPPNIILVMSDDQGWGDIGYNGNRVVKTPELDAMAREGVRLDRFYAGAPVCSPTRAGSLTGRHPYRYGIRWANDGRIPPEEVTLAEALRAAGYRSGHFGKWHVGTMTKSGKDGYRGGAENAFYSPPWENGFEVCFSNEIGGPTFNPMVWGNGEYGTPGYKYFMHRAVAPGETTRSPGVTAWPAHFWTGPDQAVMEDLSGDSSKLIMDRALDFIAAQTKEKTPFLAVVWFFTPHTPIAAGDEHRALYPDLSMEEQHWYGSLTAMDEQIGRLRHRLRELGISENTVVWFCSDNGPSWVHEYNSAGPFRGKKGTLYEGGIRVPSVVEWPAGLPASTTVAAPISTNDFYPTFVALTGAKPGKQPQPIDGINVLSLLRGEATRRSAPIAFQSPIKDSGKAWEMKAESRQQALIDDRYKLISENSGKDYALYDLLLDPSETHDVANQHSRITGQMAAHLEAWIRSCERSLKGDDYR